MCTQAAFGTLDHDSLQYHFFAGGLLGAGRLFHTRSLQHGSLWLFDGARYREFQSRTGAFETVADSALAVSIGGLSIEEAAGTVTMRCRAPGGSGEIVVRLTPRREFTWSDTISTVIHQPDMAVALTLDGQEMSGTGYCKRYTWTPAPAHWGYRFVQGFVEDGAIAVWTAEATFGTEKYDYFRMLMPDGTLVTTPDDLSCHRQNGVTAMTDLGPVSLSLEPLALWDTRLASDRMDSRMRQRACRLTVRTQAWEKRGLAINETCYGTLG